MNSPDIHFVRITARTLEQICGLSETLSPAQRHMVADNVHSIAQSPLFRRRLVPRHL